MLRLRGKGAIITGAGRGIGKAIAKKFLEEGARLLIVDIDSERIHATAEELRRLGDVYPVAGDVTDVTVCDEIIAQAKELLDQVDVLVNNAGIAIFESFLDHSKEAWDQTLAVNLSSMFLLGQRVARCMVEQGRGGAIVNMASSNAHLGEKELVAYNVSKAGVVLLTKTMAIELAQYNIRVNAVSPGFILTELAAEAGADEQFIKEYTNKIPLGRYGRPDEVASLFAFLASDEASFITGESVIIDGGQLSEE